MRAEAGRHVLHVDGTARVDVAASPARCRELLSDVPGYPSWSTLIADAELVADGPPPQVRLSARVLGTSVVMDCLLECEREEIRLRRVPYDAQDRETYLASWAIEPRRSGAAVELRVVADIDAPGPARMLRDRVSRRLVDDLIEDFARAV